MASSFESLYKTLVSSLPEDQKEFFPDFPQSKKGKDGTEEPLQPEQLSGLSMMLESRLQRAKGNDISDDTRQVVGVLQMSIRAQLDGLMDVDAA